MAVCHMIHILHLSDTSTIAFYKDIVGMPSSYIVQTCLCSSRIKCIDYLIDWFDPFN